MRETGKSTIPHQGVFNATFRRSYNSPTSRVHKGWTMFERNKSVNNEQKSKIDAAKQQQRYDPNIIEIMQKLGYSLKSIYTGLVMGNSNVVSMYEKLAEMRRAE